MRNNQTTRKAQACSSQIRPQPFEELDAKWNGKRRTRQEQARYSFEAELDAWQEADSWWPDMARKVIRDCSDAAYGRRCAEDDLLHALKEAGLLKANVRRRDGEDILESVWRAAETMAEAKAAKAARPHYSRAAMLYLERQKARS
ncbi:MAG: hypothetical protein ACK4M6_02155 [Hyphomonas sp.]